MQVRQPFAATPEWEFVDKESRKLGAQAFAKWSACRSTHVFSGFGGKQVVAYTLDNGVPKILKVLVCEDFSASLRSGVSSVWRDENDNSTTALSHLPTEVAPSCFMWHLQDTTLHLNEYRGRQNLKFSVALRTTANPSTRMPDTVYILEYATFRSIYAEVS